MAAAVTLGSAASQGHLDLQLTSRHAWRKACSFASQSACVTSQQVPFPLSFTFDANAKPNRSRTLSLKHSNKKLPDQCSAGWRCGFSASLSTNTLFIECSLVLRLLLCQQELMVPYLKPNATLGGDERTVWDCFCSPFPAGRL